MSADDIRANRQDVLHRWLPAIQERFSFTPPDLWRRLFMEGFFDPFDDNLLQLADLIWLPPDVIAGYRFHQDQIPGLIPFACTGREDLWCLYPGFSPDSDEIPVVFCPDEDEVAHAYAPSFTAFLYRGVLEEYAGTRLTDSVSNDRALAILDGYADLLAPHLPEDWATRLKDVGNRPLVGDEHGYHATISQEECARIVEEDIAWPQLDQEFEHFLGN